MKKTTKQNKAVKSVESFAEELSDAYSTDRYRGGWSACIKMMRKRGYNDRQVEAVIRSKWTRWAADRANGSSANSADLERYLDSLGDGEQAEVDDLTGEHWGIVADERRKRVIVVTLDDSVTASNIHSTVSAIRLLKGVSNVDVREVEKR